MLGVVLKYFICCQMALHFCLSACAGLVVFSTDLLLCHCLHSFLSSAFVFAHFHTIYLHLNKKGPYLTDLVFKVTVKRKCFRSLMQN